jgi:hypothetical protein
MTAMFPSIPVPENNPESLHRTCLALKKAVEMLTGADSKSRDGSSSDRFANHVFVGTDVPEALHVGDLWLATGQSYTFNIWNGTDWLLVATLPPQGEAVVRQYRTFPNVAGRRGR